MTESRGTVLAVDDDPGALSALADALGTLGFEVVQAADGVTALELAREKLPDVVLLDVQMPGMDGFEVCRQLKADPDLLLVPVVFLTARSDDIDRLIESGGVR